MNSKFYTSFVVDTEGSDDPERHFTGIIELRGRRDDPPSALEIGQLLAQKLNLESDRVRVLTWSRLH